MISGYFRSRADFPVYHKYRLIRFWSNLRSWDFGHMGLNTSVAASDPGLLQIPGFLRTGDSYFWGFFISGASYFWGFSFLGLLISGASYFWGFLFLGLLISGASYFWGCFRCGARHFKQFIDVNRLSWFWGNLGIRAVTSFNHIRKYLLRNWKKSKNINFARIS